MGDSSIVDIPEIHYARSGHVYLAYQAFGEGPFDLVVVPGVLSNIAYGWEFESWRSFYGTLASFARILLFDKRGTGISDPVPGAPSIEERMDDARSDGLGRLATSCAYGFSRRRRDGRVVRGNLSRARSWAPATRSSCDGSRPTCASQPARPPA